MDIKKINNLLFVAIVIISSCTTLNIKDNNITNMNNGVLILDDYYIDKNVKSMDAMPKISFKVDLVNYSSETINYLNNEDYYCNLIFKNNDAEDDTIKLNHISPRFSWFPKVKRNMLFFERERQFLKKNKLTLKHNDSIVYKEMFHKMLKDTLKIEINLKGKSYTIKKTKSDLNIEYIKGFPF